MGWDTGKRRARVITLALGIAVAVATYSLLFFVWSLSSLRHGPNAAARFPSARYQRRHQTGVTVGRPRGGLASEPPYGERPSWKPTAESNGAEKGTKHNARHLGNRHDVGDELRMSSTSANGESEQGGVTRRRRHHPSTSALTEMTTSSQRANRRIIMNRTTPTAVAADHLSGAGGEGTAGGGGWSPPPKSGSDDDHQLVAKLPLRPHGDSHDGTPSPDVGHRRQQAASVASLSFTCDAVMTFVTNAERNWSEVHRRHHQEFIANADGGPPARSDGLAFSAGRAVEATGPHLFRDLGEACYTVPSVLRHLNWIDKLYLIVSDASQLPPCLRPLEVVVDTESNGGLLNDAAGGGPDGHPLLYATPRPLPLSEGEAHRIHVVTHLQLCESMRRSWGRERLWSVLQQALRDAMPQQQPSFARPSASACDLILPTFNSNVIEWLMAYLPEMLSAVNRPVLYLNNDMFIRRPSRQRQQAGANNTEALRDTSSLPSAAFFDFVTSQELSSRIRARRAAGSQGRGGGGHPPPASRFRYASAFRGETVVAVASRKGRAVLPVPIIDFELPFSDASHQEVEDPQADYSTHAATTHESLFEAKVRYNRRLIKRSFSLPLPGSFAHAPKPIMLQLLRELVETMPAVQRTLTHRFRQVDDAAPLMLHAVFAIQRLDAPVRFLYGDQLRGRSLHHKAGNSDVLLAVSAARDSLPKYYFRVIHSTSEAITATREIAFQDAEIACLNDGMGVGIDAPHLMRLWRVAAGMTDGAEGTGAPIRPHSNGSAAGVDDFAPAAGEEIEY